MNDDPFCECNYYLISKLKRCASEEAAEDAGRNEGTSDRYVVERMD